MSFVGSHVLPRLSRVLHFSALHKLPTFPCLSPVTGFSSDLLQVACFLIIWSKGKDVSERHAASTNFLHS